MTYKNIKFDDSPVMRSLEKLAVKKGLVKPEELTKTASPKPSPLKPTKNLDENILKLCGALRDQGFTQQAVEVETKFFNLKRALHIYDTHGETGEDIINSAHPEGSHQMKGVEGDALIETIVDKKKAIENMLHKMPTGKEAASRDLASLVKKAGRIEKEAALNAIKIILAQEAPEKNPDDGETATAQTISSLAGRSAFLLGQETLSRMDKDIVPVMSLDKIPPQIKQGVNTYRQFILNVFQTLAPALNEAYKKAEELQVQRLKASGGDQNASRINIREVLPYLSQGKVANLGLGSVKTFGELNNKLHEIYSQLGDALQTKLLPAFDHPPFDGELKGIADKIKTSLGSAIDSLKKG